MLQWVGRYGLSKRTLAGHRNRKSSWMVLRQTHREQYEIWKLVEPGLSISCIGRVTFWP